MLKNQTPGNEKKSWLPDMDLNHDKQIQSLLCYRYTIGQTDGVRSLGISLRVKKPHMPQEYRLILKHADQPGTRRTSTATCATAATRPSQSAGPPPKDLPDGKKSRRRNRSATR
jgi:hypothetical protein